MTITFTPSERRTWAANLGLHEQYLYQCLTGRRDMGPANAQRIERESDGAITRQMVCQKTFMAIWPELAAPSPAVLQPSTGTP